MTRDWDHSRYPIAPVTNDDAPDWLVALRNQLTMIRQEEEQKRRDARFSEEARNIREAIRKAGYKPVA